MLDTLGRILAWWSSREPSTSLMMYVAAVLLFAGAFAYAGKRPNGYAAGLERFAYAFGHAVLYIGILGASYFLLNKAFDAFRPVAGGIAVGKAHTQEIIETRKRWGGEISQMEPNIKFTRSYVEVVELSGAYPNPQYIDRTVVEPVDAGGISAFAGTVTLEVKDPSLTTYIAQVDYQYWIENQSEYEVIATFVFPTLKNHYYEDLSVLQNGQPCQYDLRAGNLVLITDMKPHQTDKLEVSFFIHGMERFSYYVPQQRGIENFAFSFNLNTGDYYTFTEPSQDAIKLVSSYDAPMYRTAWTIERAIMKPLMGVKLKSDVQPDLKQWDAISIAAYAPSAAMLIGAAVLLTMLITGIRVNLGSFLLFLSIFSMQFLGFMGLDLLQVHYVIPLILFSLLTLYLTFLIYRSLPQLPRSLILILTFLFSVGYPLGNLLPDDQARGIFGMIVQSLILLYIFGLTLFVRVRQKPRSRLIE